MGGYGRVFYRLRKHNIKRKSGNIADFLRRWDKPGIAGIDSAEQQLTAVLEKAGIPFGARFELTRFPSRKLKEGTAGAAISGDPP